MRDLLTHATSLSATIRSAWVMRDQIFRESTKFLAIQKVLNNTFVVASRTDSMCDHHWLTRLLLVVSRSMAKKFDHEESD